MSNPIDADAELVDAGEAQLPATLQQAIGKRFSALEAMDEYKYRESVVKQIRPAALAELRPSDFVIMGQGDDATVYLQNSGAQRVKALLGMFYPDGQPKLERIELAAGEFEYVYHGFVASRTLRCADYVVGGRSSTDKFFDQFEGEGEAAVRIVPSEIDIRKAAMTNFENRAVSGLLGLRGLTVRDMAALKFDLAGARGVSFQKGAKGGAAGDSIPPFGNDFKELWGKPWTEATPDALRWYKGCFERNLKDESKKKYHASTTKQLEALKHEIHRRQEVAAEASKAPAQKEHEERMAGAGITPEEKAEIEAAEKAEAAKAEKERGKR